MNVVGGQIIQSNGNPIFPGTHVTGPLLAGNIKDWDGGAGLAGLGSTNPGALANVGYVRMSQAGRITQAASPGQPAGVFLSPDLIIPAQSLILSITNVIITPWNGAATTLGAGVLGNATFFMAAGALTGATSQTFPIANAGAVPIANWLNVGNVDVQLMFTSTNTGAGVGIAIVDYIQGINAATS